MTVCRLCLHCSTEENPLVLGPHARGSIWPTWPWLYGTSECPEGCCCRLCFFVWEYAGFRVQYKTLMIYVQAMKVSSTLTDEHVACLQVVICKINSGIIKQRLRGGKKGVLDELTELRKVIVEVIEREGIRIKEKFRAMKVETWKKEHPGQDPITAGFPVRMLKIQGVQCQMCVVPALAGGALRLGDRILGRDSNEGDRGQRRDDSARRTAEREVCRSADGSHAEHSQER